MTKASELLKDCGVSRDEREDGKVFYTTDHTADKFVLDLPADEIIAHVMIGPAQDDDDRRMVKLMIWQQQRHKADLVVGVHHQVTFCWWAREGYELDGPAKLVLEGPSRTVTVMTEKIYETDSDDADGDAGGVRNAARASDC